MAQSETILTLQTHPGDSSQQTVTGDKYKGDGYYGRSDGLHTVQIDLEGFQGEIIIQGSLEVDPQDDDWFAVRFGTGETIDTTGKITRSVSSKAAYTDSETSVTTYNFTGNFVWLRIKVENWTDGNINSVMLNH